MNSGFNYVLRLVVFAAACFCLAMPSIGYAEDALPVAVQDYIRIPMLKVGSGTYRKYGFGIYRATLWAPDGVWNAAKPYALTLHYLRGLSSDTLADALIGDIRDQNVTDEATLNRWATDIRKTIPAVKDGDVMTGIEIPGIRSVLFLNDAEISKSIDEAMNQAFFAIWLGDKADEDLRAALVKTSE